MEKKILTAMLSFAFLFLMAVNVSGQNLNDDVNTYGVSSKADATYLNNLPNFVDAEVAKDLLKTQIKANSATFNEAASNASTVQAEIDLYNEVFRLIYREELSVQDAIVTAFSSAMPNQSAPDVSGIANQYSNSGILQDLVNLLAN